MKTSGGCLCKAVRISLTGCTACGKGLLVPRLPVSWRWKRRHEHLLPLRRGFGAGPGKMV